MPFHNERQARAFFRRKWLVKGSQEILSDQQVQEKPQKEPKRTKPISLPFALEVPVESSRGNSRLESISLLSPSNATDISAFDFSHRNSTNDEAYRLKIELSDEVVFYICLLA